MELLEKNARACCEQINQNIKKWTESLKQHSGRLVVLRKLKQDKLSRLKDKDVDDGAPASSVSSIIKEQNYKLNQKDCVPPFVVGKPKKSLKRSEWCRFLSSIHNRCLFDDDFSKAIETFSFLLIK